MVALAQAISGIHFFAKRAQLSLLPPTLPAHHVGCADHGRPFPARALGFGCKAISDFCCLLCVVLFVGCCLFLLWSLLLWAIQATTMMMTIMTIDDNNDYCHCCVLFVIPILDFSHVWPKALEVASL